MQYKIPHYKVRLVKGGRSRSYNIAATDEIDSPAVAVQVAKGLLKNLPHEEIVIILLNGQGRITGSVTVSMGGQHSAAVYPADIFRPAVAGNAASIILAHNHPSGDPTPSDEDVRFTKRVMEAAQVLGVSLLDHVIVAGDKSSSFAAAGLLR